jgi:hypothetical protein
MSSLEQVKQFYGYTVKKWISLNEWDNVPYWDNVKKIDKDDADKFFVQHVQHDGYQETNDIGQGLEKYKQETKKNVIELRGWGKGQVIAMILSEAQKQQLKCR